MQESFDSIDKKIINLLQENSNLSAKQVALEVGLSLTPTYERLRRIENSGVINRYVALVDRKKVGKSLELFCQITLSKHQTEIFIDFEKKVVEFDEVMELYHIAGSYDYLVKIAVEDMDVYEDFIKNKIASIKNIYNIKTSFVMNEIKYSTAYKL